MDEELEREKGKAHYLGDGLYASYDGDQIRLFASDGIRITNSVYLEPAVLTAFEEYVAWLRKGKEEAAREWTDVKVQHLLHQIKALAKSPYPFPPDTNVSMERAFALGEIIGVATRALSDES